MKKKLILLCSIVFVMTLLSNIVIYAITDKSILDLFFEGEKGYVANDMLDRDGQSIEIDDYRITLEEALCEESTQFCYMIFSVTKNNGKPEADINKYGDCNCFGKNDRFSFDFMSSGGVTSKYFYDDNRLYACISVGIDEFPDEKSEYKMALTDYEQKNGDEYKTYYFDLKFKKKSKTFKFEAGEFAISPLGIRIYTKEKMEDIKIETINKNMESTEIVNTSKNIGTEGSGQRGRGNDKKEREYLYTFEFKELMDISEIDYINLNGKKYTLNY